MEPPSGSISHPLGRLRGHDWSIDTAQEERSEFSEPLVNLTASTQKHFQRHLLQKSNSFPKDTADSSCSIQEKRSLLTQRKTLGILFA